MDIKPNILLIFTDQQRYDALGVMGNNKIMTPNLDKLAKEGVLFRNAMTPCPLCAPARTCTMTGLSASALGCLENNYPKRVDNRDTISGHLSANGYWCEAIGKMHFSNIPYAESYGMDHMVLSEETRGVRCAHTQEEVVFDDYDRYLIDRGLWGWDKPTEIGYNEIKPCINYLDKEDNVTEWCSRDVCSWLKNRKPDDKPFFLWASFVKPHVPYDLPKHMVGMYDSESMDAPWVSENDGTNEYKFFSEYAHVKEFDLYSQKAGRMSKANYYANITFIDEQIGLILQTLKEQGLEENTVVIFSSDHGDMLGDHGLWYKLYGFEGSMHVPMIMKWPKHITPGTVCDEVVSLLDLYPTILHLAGIHLKDKRAGHDLFEYLHGRDGDFAFSEALYPPYYVFHVRTKKYKLLYYLDGGYCQLFDLEQDPHELMNLAHDSAYDSIKKELFQKAIAYLQTYGSGEYCLDASNHLMKGMYQCPKESISKPFSRMPWDSRIPSSSLPVEQKGLFWKQRDDWSIFFEKESVHGKT
jgi:arylsulfatase